MQTHLSVLIVSILLMNSSIHSQPVQLSTLEAAVEALDRDPAMKSANWGITVMQVRSGKVLMNHQGHKSLATASTMKIVSTATALAVLGPNHRFETFLEYSGQITAEGELNGNVYIRGSGDPSLGSDRFGESYEFETILAQWVEEIQALGVRKISGEIIGDASCYGSQLTPPKWPWEDMGNYYGAGAGGLNIHENKYRLDLKPGSRQGDKTSVVGTYPEQSSIRFQNEILTGKPGSGDNGYIYGSPYTHLRYLRGTIPPGKPVFSIKGSIPDPALYAAESLQKALGKAGIDCRRLASTVRLGADNSQTRTRISTHQSPRLQDIAYQTNQYSVNLYAEALALAAGAALNSKGNTSSALDAIESYWSRQGLSTSGMYLRDGSGLSPNNVLSPYQLTGLLQKVALSPYFEAFDASLPVAGRSGSLKRMMRGTAAEGNLRAKSGYISGVRGYAGYVEAPNGELLAFAMIANYYSCSASQMRQKLSRLMVRLAEAR
ncbi:MAG: D-alanyl-D-alanine carboxypeptidase/D-alanyl-D-alanine-endopeptidase [Bacteroidota bacterium]